RRRHTRFSRDWSSDRVLFRSSNELMAALTHVGDATTTIGVTLVLLMIPGLREVGVITAFALVSSHLAVQLLKRSFTRERPRLPRSEERRVGKGRSARRSAER